MNHALLLTALALLAPVNAAVAAGPPRPSRASDRYHEARLALSVPSGSLTRVRTLVRKLKADSEGNERLTPQAFKRLSFQEKFTYVMIHGEDSSQNCSDMPRIVDEERKIFAFTPYPFDDEEAAWSDQQRAFLKNNRPQVISAIRATVTSQGRVGANFKHAILELKAVELIPDLVTSYQRTRRDHDILTVLMLLMKEAKYRPIRAVPVYQKLFGNEMNFEAFALATPANQRLVTDHALRFYQSTRRSPRK